MSYGPRTPTRQPFPSPACCVPSRHLNDMSCLSCIACPSYRPHRPFWMRIVTVSRKEVICETWGRLRRWSHLQEGSSWGGCLPPMSRVSKESIRMFATQVCNVM
ncbi:hypothetical protein BDP55DRAFT_665799, partial [Colletotrichum godetiae]